MGPDDAGLIHRIICDLVIGIVKKGEYKMRKALLALAVSTFAVTSALAVELTEIDADNNGVISMEEAKVAMPNLSQEDFTAADVDGDGSLNAEELGGLGG